MTAATAILTLLLTASAAFAAGAEAPIFYPAPPAVPRIQFLKSYRSVDEFDKPQGWFSRLVFGSKPAETLGKPYGVAVRGGKAYLCDLEAGDVRILDLARNRHDWLARPQGVKLRKPTNIAFAADGSAFVADPAVGLVAAFGPDGRYLRGYGEPGWKPTDVAVSGAALFVLDIASDAVRVLSLPDGRQIGMIGGTGSAEGKLFKPTNLALGPDDSLFVSDTMNFRVQRFSRAGKFLGAVGSLGDTPGTFSRPKGLAVDGEGRLYVVDAAFDNVQIFDEKSRPLLFFGGAGEDPGQMYLPADVFIDDDPADLELFRPRADPRFELKSLIWVSSQFGPRLLSVYGFGTWRAGAAR